MNITKGNTHKDHKRYIQTRLSEVDKLCAVAEEASELAQAVLKLRRVDEDCNNGTPVTLEVALANYKEEIIDVLICLMADGWNIKQLLKEAKQSDKWERWAIRIAHRIKEEANEQKP